MPNEVEIKFLVDDLKALRARLRSAGFHLKTPRTREFNQLYDFPDGTLGRRGEIIRLREYGKSWTLTFKAKAKPPKGLAKQSRERASKHKSRLEIETAVAKGLAVHQMLLALGLEPSFAYEKFRAEWADGRGQVVVDETPIGDVAEIEGAPQWIDAIARKLGVTRADYITASYGELFDAWKKATGSKASNLTWKEVSASPKTVLCSPKTVLSSPKIRKRTLSKRVR